MSRYNNPNSVNFLPIRVFFIFSAGIHYNISFLDANKASGPDNMHPCIFNKELC